MAKGKRGGARPNSGPEKGTKYKPTLEKEAARDALRQIILEEMREMVQAQIAQAKGLKYLVTRDKRTGKFIRVTEAMAKRKAGDDENEETIEVWEKDPSTPAFTDLMNRAIDKPKEQEQEIKLTGEADLIAALANGRKRAAERNREKS